ncbi:MAG: spoIIIJ-associated protein [Thermoleophilaceae bacterium]|jgi:spoIIIJ-associated protein|nr:spoIIIJ-associated protein [Thermoleophilaceae bacterium]
MPRMGSEGGDASARAEGEGTSLGEAKWSAMKELERSHPGVSADDVEFEVLDEGDEAAGRPARVSAQLDASRAESLDGDLPDEPAERVRALVGRVAVALGLRASVDIEETDDAIRATVNGDDLGILIGKHGSTIDALQHLALRVGYKGGPADRQVIVDAAGYRERREMALQRAADRAVSDALDFGRPVELEPMTASERRLVHTYLRDRSDVQTHSEGDEPDRRLVVSPVSDGS